MSSHSLRTTPTAGGLRPVRYVALAAAFVTAGAWMSAPTADEAAVRAVLQHYVQGHATGDGAHMRIAFHPAARLFWSSADTLATRTSDEYIARMSGKPAADEASGVRKRRIADIDVTGNAATGKIVLDYPDAYIVDYMSLLKTDGQWKIVNKIFMTEMKKK
jgi:hypothetical protein